MKHLLLITALTLTSQASVGAIKHGMSGGGGGGLMLLVLALIAGGWVYGRVTN